MMNINEIIEDIVLLKLENFEPLKDLGIIQKSLFAKILGYDEHGIWIHHPKFQVADGVSKHHVHHNQESWQRGIFG
jgi:hypothetical protein